MVGLVEVREVGWYDEVLLVGVGYGRGELGGGVGRSSWKCCIPIIKLVVRFLVHGLTR
jgi:hypothetical protein